MTARQKHMKILTRPSFVAGTVSNFSNLSIKRWLSNFHTSASGQIHTIFYDNEDKESPQ